MLLPDSSVQNILENIGQDTFVEALQVALLPRKALGYSVLGLANEPRDDKLACQMDRPVELRVHVVLPTCIDAGVEEPAHTVSGKIHRDAIGAS